MYGLCLALICFTVAASAYILGHCNTSCERGQKCVEKTCETCETGTFQPEVIHTLTFCKRWTEKPVQAHWVITKNGSATEDREWDCERGYKKFEYTTNEFECVVDITQATTVSSVQLITTLQEQRTTTSAATQDVSNQLSPWIIVLIVLIVLVVLSVICAIGYCKLRSKLPCCRKNYAIDSSDENSKVEKQPLKGLENLKYYEDIVKSLGLNNAYKLLHFLPFNTYEFIENTLKLEREKNHDPNVYYVQTFLTWEKKCSDLEHRKEVENAIENMNNMSNANNERPHLTTFYFKLCEQMGVQDGKELLVRLLGFSSAQRYLEIKEYEKKHWPLQFTETLHEWTKVCDKNSSIKETLQKQLMDMYRTDVSDFVEKELSTSAC